MAFDIVSDIPDGRHYIPSQAYTSNAVHRQNIILSEQLYQEIRFTIHKQILQNVVNL